MATVWTEAETDQLLAWIEHCYEVKLSFRETVVDYINSKSPGRNFNFEQVKGKAWRLAHEANVQRKDLLERGIQILNLQPRRVYRIVSHLRDVDLECEKQRLDVRPADQLVGRGDEVPQKEIRCLSDIVVPPKRPSNTERRCSKRLKKIDERNDPRSPSLHDPHGKARVQSTNTRVVNGDIGDEIQASPGPNPLTSMSTTADRSSMSETHQKSDSRDYVHSSEPTDESISGNIECSQPPQAILEKVIEEQKRLLLEARRILAATRSEHLEAKHNLSEAVNQMTSLASDCSSTLEKIKQEHREARNEMIRLESHILESLAVGKQQQSELKLEMMNVLREEENLSATNSVKLMKMYEIQEQQKRDANSRRLAEQRIIGQARFKEACEQEKEVINLRRKIQSLDSMCQFAGWEKNHDQPIALSDETLQEQFSYIASLIDDFARRDCRQLPTNEESFKECIQRLDQICADDPDLPCVQRSFLRVVPREHIVQVIVSVCVCRWVFDSDFPTFDRVSIPVHRHYQKILGGLTAKNGKNLLTIVDLKAHHELVHSTLFEEILLPQRSKALAQRLSHLLAVAIQTDDVSSNPEIEAWRHPRGNPEHQQSRLHDLFRTALKLKAELMLTNKFYSLVWSKPGELFDGKRMEDAFEEMHMTSGSTTSLDRRVQACFFPAIYVDGITTIDGWSDGGGAPEVVVYRNCSESELCHEVGSRKLLKPAMVSSALQ